MKARLALVAAALAAAGCASVPSGPREMALPGTGKNFEQFRADDFECRRYADVQANGSPRDAQADAAIGSAAVGTAVGALAGGLLGGNSRGAAAGAGIGLITGAAAGAGMANRSAYGAQQRYDNAYKQCMYAKGHRIPVHGRYEQSRYQQQPPQPPAAPHYPPPPPPPR